VIPNSNPPVSSGDIILLGTECVETGHRVCYFYRPQQSAVTISLIRSDNRSGRICKECCNEMIDKVCISGEGYE
jgi:hypothetical protein